MRPSSARTQPTPRFPKSVQYDGRPGLRLDRQWTGRAASSHQQKKLSANLLDAVGLRDEFEGMYVESRRKQAALKEVLRIRDSVPGVASPIPATMLLESDVDDQLPHWEQGKFCFVAGRDVPRLQKAISLLEQVEECAALRLTDEGVEATWQMSKARTRLSEERRLASGRGRLVPRQVLVDSPWLNLPHVGQLAFRLYPHGDKTARAGDAALFLWMAQPPGLTFTFILHIGGKPCIAPRLWEATHVHYRVEVGWVHIHVALMEREEDDCLPIAFQILQWHHLDEDPGNLAHSAIQATRRRSRTRSELPSGTSWLPRSGGSSTEATEELPAQTDDSKEPAQENNQFEADPYRDQGAHERVGDQLLEEVKAT